MFYHTILDHSITSGTPTDENIKSLCCLLWILHTHTHTELRIQVAFIQSLGMYIVITIFFTPNTPGADPEFYEGDQNIKREWPGPEVTKEMFSVLKLVAYLATVPHISDDFAECFSQCTPFSPLNKQHIHIHI